MKVFTALAGTLVFAAAANAGYVDTTSEVYVGAGWAENGYVGLTTYRVYANFTSEDDALLAVNGSSLGDMSWYSWDGSFYNASILDSLTAPQDATPAIWLNQWDTYVTLDTDTAAGDATALTPGFAGEVGDLAGDFTTANAAWYISPDDFPQGLADGFRIQIAQITVATQTGAAVDGGGMINYAFGDGTTILGETFVLPAPGALALLGLAGLARRRRR